ncbi:MAG: alpha/beta fold hydrolase [Deltaproteobacteria bacterium]|nr:alpha/beta fold hydrolase [Deltaproteobacteria bacterium]
MLSLLLLACTAELDVVDACPLATNTWLETADGAAIALHHHPGRGPAVLLVHGIASNHRFWDLDSQHSLARWLVDRGYDAWLLDLRGHGLARRDADGTPQLSGWTVDDYGRHDVAAAVQHIQEVTGRHRLAYVGHSMGGMVGGIYAALGGAENLSAMVLVGSPGTFERDAPLVGLAAAGFKAGGATLWWFETPLAADVAAALGPLTPGRLQERIYNTENLSGETERKLLGAIVSPMFREEMQQLGRMIDNERFESADGQRDWLAELGGVTVPTLGIAGSRDEIGRPEWVRAFVQAMGGPSSFTLVPGYGHVDLGLGERAGDDVFPHIGAWLDRYATP